MKTFLTLCICAMVSAGIYGFVDMEKDIHKGTMIRYDRGEQHKTIPANSRLLSPKISALKKVNGNVAGEFDLSNKIAQAKAKKKNEEGEFTFNFKSFSRGNPELYEMPIELDSTAMVVADSTQSIQLATADTLK